MNKTRIFGSILLASIIAFGWTRGANAQMMGYYNGANDSEYGSGSMMDGYFAGQPEAQASTSPAMDDEEAAGRAIAGKLQAKTLSCSSLTQADYQSLGEYYMSLMMGSGHDAMDSYIVGRYGQSYDEEMHVATGERFSGCDAAAAFPAGMMGFGPMMGWGNGYGGAGYGNSNGNGYYGMMGGWGGPFGYGIGGAIFMAILWILAIVGLIAAIRWIMRIGHTRSR